MNKGNIKILTEYFYPDIAATGKLMTDLAVGLKKKGFNVEVFTGQPTYDSYKKRKLPKASKYKDIKINRITPIRLNNNYVFLRFINWIIFTFMIGLKLFLNSRNDDILLTVTNPPILPFLGALFNILRKQRYIPIIYDIYPEIAVKLGFVGEKNPIVKIWKTKNKFLYNNASRIVIIGEKMKNKIIENNNINSIDDKVRVIHNWEVSEFIKPKMKKENSFASKHDYNKIFTILYSGNLGYTHDLLTIIRAAEKMKDLPVKFVFIGEGVQKKKLKDFVKENNLDNVDFHPYQPHEKLPETLTCGDISVISEDSRVNGLCVSCKIYSSLASGKALIGLVDENSDIAEIIENCKCGIRVDPGDTDDFVKAVEYFMKNEDELCNMGKRARNYFEENFTFELALSKYVRLLEEIS